MRQREIANNDSEACAAGEKNIYLQSHVTNDDECKISEIQFYYPGWCTNIYIHTPTITNRATNEANI